MQVATAPDPRHRNQRFDHTSPATYLVGYAAALGAALASVDADELTAACTLLEDAAGRGARVFSIGNGGSAAISDHLCCDWTKGTHTERHPVIDATSLTSNVALYTALANDFGFETAFARHLGLVAKRGDVLVAISSSGNSANILQAVAAARMLGMTTIGLTGFGGGGLRDAADIALHVDVANYGIVEDAHQAIMHVIAQYLACHRDGHHAPD